MDLYNAEKKNKSSGNKKRDQDGNSRSNSNYYSNKRAIKGSTIPMDLTPTPKVRNQDSATMTLALYTMVPTNGANVTRTNTVATSNHGPPPEMTEAPTLI